jgi:hypothetical protein
MVACAPCACGSLRKRTIGVSPTASTMLSKTRPRPGRCTALAGDGASMTISVGGNNAREIELFSLEAARTGVQGRIRKVKNSLQCKIV